MISKLSCKIVDLLIKQSIIIKAEQELYVYGFFMLLSQIFYFIIALIFGIVFHVILESIIFYIAFQFIRRYAGGYHASTETRCEIMSSLSMILCIAAIKMLSIHEFIIPLLIITTVAAAGIFSLCPLDTPEKPLSKEEHKYYRKISWSILLIIVAIIAICYCLKCNSILIPCCISLILEGVLIIAGKVKKLTQKTINDNNY